MFQLHAAAAETKHVLPCGLACAHMLAVLYSATDSAGKGPPGGPQCACRPRSAVISCAAHRFCSTTCAYLTQPSHRDTIEHYSWFRSRVIMNHTSPLRPVAQPKVLGRPMRVPFRLMLVMGAAQETGSGIMPWPVVVMLGMRTMLSSRIKSSISWAIEPAADTEVVIVR